VIIELHFVEGDEKGAAAVAALEEQEIDVNGEVVKVKFAQLSDIFRVDIPDLQVKTEEIRIKRVKGRISLISINIIPLPDDNGAATKEEVTAAKTKTFIGCPFKDDVTNCAYNEKDVPLVQGCIGMFKKLDYDDDPKVRCLMKCTDDTGVVEPPEPPVVPLPDENIVEEEAKPLVSPVTN